VYFYHAGREAGADTLLDWADRFGFGRPSGVDLPSESTGNLPTFEGGPLDEDQLLELAIGQSTLTVTPLQLARMTAAIANGGRLVKPQLVAGYGATRIDAAAREARAANSSNAIPDLHPATVRALREGFSLGYVDPSGESTDVAGCVGYAEVGRGKSPHGWFTGYLPKDEPAVAVVLLIEHADREEAKLEAAVRLITEVVQQHLAP